MRRKLRVGILYSETGPYACMGRDCRDGADLAIGEIADDVGFPLEIEPVYADPGGDPRRYLEEVRAMLRPGRCRNIIGTITSLARKEIIPLIEKHDSLLWYVCAYEGFEANENVIYTGACPNQHLMPLLDNLLPSIGNRAYLIGVNFIWGWEMNRLARELLVRSGGTVLAERYLPMEDTDVGRIIADIESKRPDFVLNNLVGPGCHAFLGAFAELGRRDPAFSPERCPVISCDLAECDLALVPDNAATGQYSTAPYFATLDHEANRAFKARAAVRYGEGRRTSTFFEGAYTAVRLLAETARRTGTDDPVALKSLLHTETFETPHGPMRIDRKTNHAALPFHLGRVRPDGEFEVVFSREAIPADPYLTSRYGVAGASVQGPVP